MAATTIILETTCLTFKSAHNHCVWCELARTLTAQGAGTEEMAQPLTVQILYKRLSHLSSHINKS